ncbi:hypothetical protein IFR05_016441 [Cadophora sp. M221]|nr:hypothetical protein IFR05_016441 [Cadophora sp. M221]
MSSYGRSQLHSYYDSGWTYENPFQDSIPSYGSQLQGAASTAAPVYQNTPQLVQGETSTLQENSRTPSDSAEFLKTPIGGNPSHQLGASEEYNNYGYAPGDRTPTFPQYSYPPVSNVSSSRTTLMDPFGGLQHPLHEVKSLQFGLNYDRQVPDFDIGLLMSNSSPESMEHLVPGHAEYKLDPSAPTPAAYYQ